jgi:hypothetical protein
MALPRHTSNELQNLDYNKIPLYKVQFLSIAFDGDACFKFPPMLLTTHRPSQMQGMDTKYDGHAWCKVITTNIKNSFGFNFSKACHLGHLWCFHDDCENFMRIGSGNEIFYCDECTHIPIVGQKALSPFASSFACKFYHSLPCVWQIVLDKFIMLC